MEIPGNIQVIEDNVVEVKFSSMFPKQNYHIVTTSFKSDNIDNLNVEHASALQNKSLRTF